MRTVDFETPADRLRIQLILDIMGDKPLSEKLDIVYKYDEYQQVKYIDALKEIIECKKGKSTSSYMREIAKNAL